MHGFIFSEIQKYVETKFDTKTWSTILHNAGLSEKSFENFLDYSDSDAVAIVSTAARMTGIPAGDILEDFGKFLGADLMRVYRPVIDPKWKTIDFLTNVETTIHQVVRSRNRSATPPALSCERTSGDEVVITYASPRKMCALARGIAYGVADHYGEPITITETSCMHRGDEVCRLRVVKSAPA